MDHTELTPTARTTTASAVRTAVTVNTWQDAVLAAGDLLTATGSCTPGYVSAMCDAVRDLGPYIVIAPGVAMPHARPEAGVLAPGLAVITLSNPVEFGHTANDPVDLVIAFAALDKAAHLATLQRIVSLIQDGEALSALRAATTDDEARRVLSAHHLAEPTDHTGSKI